LKLKVIKSTTDVKPPHFFQLDFEITTTDGFYLNNCHLDGRVPFGLKIKSFQVRYPVYFIQVESTEQRDSYKGKIQFKSAQERCNVNECELVEDAKYTIEVNSLGYTSSINHPKFPQKLFQTAGDEKNPFKEIKQGLGGGRLPKVGMIIESDATSNLYSARVVNVTMQSQRGEKHLIVENGIRVNSKFSNLVEFKLTNSYQEMQQYGRPKTIGMYYDWEALRLQSQNWVFSGSFEYYSDLKSDEVIGGTFNSKLELDEEEEEEEETKPIDNSKFPTMIAIAVSVPVALGTVCVAVTFIVVAIVIILRRRSSNFTELE